MSDEKHYSFRYWVANSNISLNTIASTLSFIAASMVFGLIGMGLVLLQFVSPLQVPMYKMFYENSNSILIGLFVVWIITLFECLYTVWSNFVKIEQSRVRMIGSPKQVPKQIQKRTVPTILKTQPKSKKPVMVSMVDKRQKQSEVDEISNVNEQPITPSITPKKPGGRPKGSKNKPRDQSPKDVKTE